MYQVYADHKTIWSFGMRFCHHPSTILHILPKRIHSRNTQHAETFGSPAVHKHQSPPISSPHSRRALPYPISNSRFLRAERLVHTDRLQCTKRAVIPTILYSCSGDQQSATSTTETRARSPVYLETPTSQHRPPASRGGGCTKKKCMAALIVV